MNPVPELPPRCGSWIVVRKADGEAVLETFSPRVAAAINVERYHVMSALAWLCAFNRAVEASR